MLIVSLILIPIGLVLLVLAMRGRVVARGTFCRACGFDLHGLGSDQESSKCPECGRAVGQPGTTRAIRRSKSRRLTVVSIVLLLIGVGLSAVHFSGNASSFYAAMPHRVVLSASKWGDDTAIDELIVRLGPKKQTPEWVWEDAIGLAMAHQQDERQQWKPRWGEVLSLAIQANLLSDEQLASVVRNGTRIDVWLRSKIRPGDSYVGYLCETRSKRISAMTRVDTGYMLDVEILDGGVVENGVEVSNGIGGGSSSATSFIFNTSGPTGMMATGSRFMLPASMRKNLKVGDSFEVYMDVQIKLRARTADRVIQAEPFRFTQQVTVVGEEEPIVTAFQDPIAAKQIREGMSIEPLMALNSEKVMMGTQSEVATSTLILTAKPKSISGTLYLRHHLDGELFEGPTVTSIATPIDPNQNPPASIRHSHQLSFYIKEDDLERREAFNRVIRDGVVDVVFLTDPSVSESNPKIDEVVDLRLVFVGVSVIVIGSDLAQGIDPSETVTPASVYIED